MADTDLPPGWSAHAVPGVLPTTMSWCDVKLFDRNVLPLDGRTYYYDSSTKTSTWTKPKPVFIKSINRENVVDNSALTSQLTAERGPTDVYAPWQKPGSQQEARLVEQFTLQAGQEAAGVLAKLQSRHYPFHFSKWRPDQPTCVVWEESWSSTQQSSRDSVGEALILKLGKALKAKGILFDDPYFPPAKSSLFVDPAQADKNKNAAAQERFDEQAFLAGKDIDNKIRWMRAKDIGNPNEKAVVFSGQISPDDVAQGQLGNCYFVAALSACASAKDDILINDLVVEDCADVGLYGIKFYFMGKWVTVAVDDQFPCELISNQWKPIFAGPKKHSEEPSGVKEIWPLLFEKAFAKLHGSYECTDAGMSEDALQYLTGGLISYMDLKGQPDQFATLKSALGGPDGNDQFVACGCRGQREGFTPAILKAVGLFSGHAYSLSRVAETASGVKLVQVRNPWGRCEWNGRYSDKSPEMTEALKTELHAHVEEDGSFYMAFDDFCKYFAKAKMVDPTCFNRLSEDSRARVDGAAGCWIAGRTAGGKLGPEAFNYNPKIELTGDGGEVWLTLYQPDTRHTCIAPVESDLGVPMMDVFCYFGPVGTRPSEVISLYGGFEGDRLQSKKVMIQAGVKYNFIVTASAAGMEGMFAITACGKGVQLKAAPAQDPPPSVAAAMARRESRPRR